GGRILPPLLPRTPRRPASALRDPPRLLHRAPVPRRVGPALRLHLPRGPVRSAGLPRPVPSRSGPPLFAAPAFGRPPRDRADPSAVPPQEAAVADVRQLDLKPGRTWRTRVAGVFLFLPLLARIRFDQLVRQAGYPGSRMVPAVGALLSLLALKLSDKERHSHISDFNFDEALGLFAGLNVLPKKSYATDYSYRTARTSGGCFRGGLP